MVFPVRTDAFQPVQQRPNFPSWSFVRTLPLVCHDLPRNPRHVHHKHACAHTNSLTLPLSSGAK